MKKDFVGFTKNVRNFMKDRVFDDYLRCFAYGTEASCYHYIPKVVVFPQNEDEVVKIIKLANKHETPLSFRAAGSSLSGQASCEDVLVVANDNWKKIQTNEDGSVIRLGCGVIGQEANNVLKDYSRKIGPDPATIATALIGGIVNNNASGMCCGVDENSYKTIKSIRIILSDGTILDTSDELSVANFIKEKPNMIKDILDIKDEILKDAELTELIKRKYKIKNTTGYGLNSFVDFSELKDIINHIFVGSEGTLGFVSEVVYNSVIDEKYKACGLLFYKSLTDASKAIIALTELKDIVGAAEMMDYACLKSVRGIDGVPKEVYEVEEGTTAILLQTQSDFEDELNTNVKTIKDALGSYEMAFEPLYSSDPKVYDGWWKIRKGILPIVAGRRKSKTSVITEDLCFEIDKFCDGVELITNLFKKYGFSKNGVIFGHALVGNLHFVITPDLSNEKEFNNFKNLMEDMANEVTKMNGSIKAEHGTGRMVAPFVELEWGKKAYLINKKIKNAFDPKALLNPNVIISYDKEIHIKNIKNMNETEDYINFCMECGFCEKACPSKFLTLTPRQRIAVTREIDRLKSIGETTKADKLQKEYEYLGDETCAACSMCKIYCPLSIDTAQIAINLRRKNSSKSFKIANAIYENMDKVINLAKFGLSTANLSYSLVGAKNISAITKKINSFMPFPYANEYLPLKNSYKRENRNFGEKKVIYFTTCMNRGFAPSKLVFDKRSIQEVFESVCKKAGVSVVYPEGIDKLCCGKSFMDYEEIRAKNKDLLKNILLEASEGGKHEIILDHGACSTYLINELKDENQLKIVDMCEFLEEIMPKLKIKKIDENLIVHKMCAMKKRGKGDLVENLAKICTTKNVYNTAIDCCGFAGNKGFFTPELTLSATKTLKFIPANLKRGFSNSSTCEIGVSHSCGIPFMHIVYLIDECSKELYVS
ncbi:FAD/FMN-containing dehydrogenase [Campylobacter blaseri]|uniref:D-lactate dehydrogenase (cytochrome) n=1 Tax=Campylobacter blaseri TaxID=2042961 RepID=A0A2P8QZE4_9BACT|nr:FAD-binding and (Fe-S)-binding domain-containing protein [Campylobacter blaseri]PSM51612.1 FAD-binding oxidoreductase [Campylobacter blaseri]PSM53405.1 FAD-binding oxidoreductase [Campylobacter blaseri]QKF86701.1 FAD/FMN-containing dehydrogenase [Campylobacter blaseri]